MKNYPNDINLLLKYKMSNFDLELNNKNKSNKNKLSKKINGKSFINKIIEDKIIKNNFINGNNTNKNDLSENDLSENDLSENDLSENDSNIKYANQDDIELEKLDKELSLKSGYNSLLYPKNYGNMWLDEERKKIIKLLKKNEFDKNYGLFDESIIFDIAKKLQRTEYAVKEEIKKMIYNEYIEGSSYEKISEYFNIPVGNIKLILKIYIDKNSQKIINQMETENKLIRLKIENIKLKKELYEINNTNN
jgi:hypothetical protein